jgi:N6-adenosine-specific RNA methylase IME4
MDEAAFAGLVEDIRHRSLVHPIVLFEGKVLDGRNRLRACRKARVKPRFVDYKGRDPLGHVVSLNLQRRHLTESQRAVLALDILPRLEAEAKGRQRMGRAKLPQPQSAGKSRDHAARLFKVSGRYIQDAKKIQKSAPELVQQVRDGIVTIVEAKMLCGLTARDRGILVRRGLSNPKLNLTLECQALKRRRILHQATRLETVRGRYQIIYADCPWETGPSRSDRAVQNHYPGMSMEQLKALPVKRLSADDSALFMWTTAARLKDALDLMECWGFEYKSNLAWVKGPQWQLGWWFRNRHELLLVGVRGKPPTPIKIPQSVLQTNQHNKKRQHSQKPEEVYALIENMWPQVSMRRVELFARISSRKGWSVWGAETTPTKCNLRVAELLPGIRTPRQTRSCQHDLI